MSSSILFWVLVLHCHGECTFGGHTAAIAVYRTFAECESDKGSMGQGQSFTCEIRKVIVNGGQIEAVAP